MTQEIAWEKVSTNYERGTQFNFDNQGDTLQGELTDIREGNTVHGSAVFIDVRTETETFTTILPTALKNQIVPDMLHHLVKIVYLGYQRNEKTKRDFKAFDVFKGPKVVHAEYSDNLADSIPF
jgi:hypothetical protein